MACMERLELPNTVLETVVLPLNYTHIMAPTVGFEPTDVLPSTVFKTAPISRTLASRHGGDNASRTRTSVTLGGLANLSDTFTACHRNYIIIQLDILIYFFCYNMFILLSSLTSRDEINFFYKYHNINETFN